VTGGQTFSAVSAGETFACGLTAAGAAYCWGENSAGNLGTGTTTSSSAPVAVAGGLAFQQLSGGTTYSFACGVTTLGAAYCWGWNMLGQLGTGSTTGPAVCNGYACSTTPVAVVGGYTFRAVSAGGAFACGVTTGGVAYCWGWNALGQLGDSATTTSATPVAVAGGHSFSAVTAGGAFACGLTAAGAAYCWGANSLGELGDSTQTNRIVPVAVAGGHSFATLVAGNLSVCGLTTTGVAYCWGNNTAGELGNGTLQLSTVPTKMANQP
jgi:alpha-tubulin suppressor-like RCC1 family protein